MKLAIIHPFQFRYKRGIERFVWSFSHALANRGIDISLLTWQWPDPISWGERPPNLEIHQMPNLRYFRAQCATLWYLSQLARKRYDWVLLFFPDYGESGLMRALHHLRSQPYCIVFHYPREHVPHRYMSFERSRLPLKTDALIAVSDFVGRGVEAQFGKPCLVIPNGVDTNVFCTSPEIRANARERLDIKPEVPLLVSLAALEERKGIQWVIRAIPHLLNDFPELCYWVLGEGTYRSVLEAEVHALGLEKHVRLLGNRDDVTTYLAAADISCLLATGEAFPMTLIESMAMELSVLVSQHPPFPDLVSESWGSRVDEQDTLAVAESIRQLLTDPERRRQLGQAGREQVLRNYTWNQVADRYLKVFASGFSKNGKS